MKTIIAGGRDIYITFDQMQDVILNSGIHITEVICGMACGVDECGFIWAKTKGVPIKEFPANWKLHGKAAGPIRNREMAAYADALILIWDGKSRGSTNMLREASKQGLLIKEYTNLPGIAGINT